MLETLVLTMSVEVFRGEVSKTSLSGRLFKKILFLICNHVGLWVWVVEN